MVLPNIQVTSQHFLRVYRGVERPHCDAIEAERPEPSGVETKQMATVLVEGQLPKHGDKIKLVKPRTACELIL